MMHLAVAINDPEHKLSSALISLFTRSHAYHVEPVFSDGATFCCSPKFMGMTNRKYDHYHWILMKIVRKNLEFGVKNLMLEMLSMIG